MILYVLCARYRGEVAWVVDAVDEFTAEDNPDARGDAEKRARERNSADVDLRWIEVKVPNNFLDIPFNAPTVDGEVKP